MSSIEQKLPSIATLRAIAALRSPHLALVRPARIGLGFETVSSSQRSLAQLESVVSGPGRLALPYSLRLLLDAMAGLGTLHRAFGFVHGEVQPEHVLLGNDGVGRLLPVVRAHWVRGEERRPERLYYLAPEKLLGDHVDARSDVFSVGVLLWEAVSGKRLLDASEVEDIISRLMSGGIPLAQAPEEEAWAAPLSSIAERALSVDPARRFATLAEMKDEMERVSLRYLASTPGMAEVFVDPSRHVRSDREPKAPDSQRITLPPHQAPPTIKPRPLSQPPPAEPVKPSGVGVADYLDEELTTKPNAAPLPIAARRPHVNTLPGNAPPFALRDASPAARPAGVPPSVPVIITPLPKPPANPVDLASARARPRSTTPVSFPPPPANPPPSLRPEPASRSAAASLSPLVAARPPSSQAPRFEASFEPSFELLRPRRRRGSLWLAVLAAAAAIALFAARPLLFEPAPESRGEASSAEPGPSQAAPHAAVAAPPAVVTPETPPKPHVAGVGGKPTIVRPAPRPRAPREEHVVVEDTIDPSIQALREPTPAAPPEPTPSPEPTAAPEPAPPPPPPPAKAKPAASADADRYGI